MVSEIEKVSKPRGHFSVFRNSSCFFCGYLLRFPNPKPNNLFLATLTHLQPVRLPAVPALVAGAPGGLPRHAVEVLDAVVRVLVVSVLAAVVLARLGAQAIFAAAGVAALFEFSNESMNYYYETYT